MDGRICFQTLHIKVLYVCQSEYAGGGLWIFLLLLMNIYYNLPKNLTYLNMDNATNITDVYIQFLPRTLTHLNIGSANNLTDLCIQYLPGILTHLTLLSNNNLTHACIIHLPRTLNYLNLDSNQNLTDSCIQRLPRSLIYLHMGQTKTSPMHALNILHQDYNIWTFLMLIKLLPYIS